MKKKRGFLQVISIVSLSIFLLASCCFGKYSGGTGEPNDPYRIGSASDLLQLRADGGYFYYCLKLINDIDLAGYSFTGAVLPKNFNGVFDGNDHVISNVTITGDTSDGSDLFIGFFRTMGSSGIIKNLGLENINIIGRIEYPWDSDIGSLAGSSYGTITNCYATGTVSGSLYIGGLVGTGWIGSSITNCYTDIQVDGGSYVGGLVGQGYGSVTNCYSAGEVNSSSASLGMAGGLVGGNGGNIVGCYATGAVTGKLCTGGLIGYDWGSFIINCYSAGLVLGDQEVGGLIGNSTSTIVAGCFWDIETSGQMTSSGGTGKTTVQMQDANTYIDSGWAYHNWVIDDGLDYPRLAWENSGGLPIPEPPAVPLSGSGTEQDPYQIWTAGDFALLSQYTNILNKHIALMADVNLAGTQVNPIGDFGYFTGVFEGNGNTIRNADINMPDRNYVGLFSRTRGQIRNLGLEDSKVAGYSYVGSLAGDNDGGVIINCYNKGIVDGNYYVGGLAGYNNGIITGCHNSGIVSGGRYLGGLVGINADSDINPFGYIKECFNTGQVSGENYVGGLAGMSDGLISSSYSTGAVSGNEEVGGLVGTTQSDFSLIVNCYSTGSVSGSCVGGILGMNWGAFMGNNYNINIKNCYSTSAVTEGYGLVGSVFGNNDFDNSFWDIETSGTTDGVGDCDPDPNGATGLPTAQMQDINTYIDAGWDFSYTDGNEADWFIQIDEYPILVWQISPADIYTDGRNNFRDFSVFAQFWLRDDCGVYNYYCDWADLDFDGDVDIDDLAILMDYWLERGIYN
ncbi:MAG: hypothetical protein JW806_06475 [Sedimentisphaerales bacterium]|nr:hypothetical protein [Sedimentisphaerales bacterium]